MNIFNKKLGQAEEQVLPINPIELYETCPYKDGYGYLRAIQEEVLNSWHLNRNDKDVICKMNTGSGKTLTGLLMLYSKLIEKKEPCLYTCPDSQLVDQTIALAELYGIPVCKFDGTKYFPKDFINSKKILVCTFQKLFNGKSIFNRDNVNIGAIILDDAHKCVDIAREKSSLKLPRKHPIAIKLFSLFESALKFQLPGSFNRLSDGDPTMVMKVPYWAWMDNHEKIIEIINNYVSEVNKDSDKTENTDGIIFKWNFMFDNLLTYDCYIGGNTMEINPIHVPYHEIRSFHEAGHRYVLSATFEDDYDLIKDLGISYDSIIKPIVPKDRKDIGKRLILAPKRFDPKLNEKELDAFILNFKKENHNVIVLVPSAYKSEKWIEIGAEYVDKDNISEALVKLENSEGNFMVFNNRYDGIDLHGSLCRILVIDGLPMYGSLQEQYLEYRLESMRSGKKAQIIEQGLGRGVRSGGDYCVVYLLGSDLIGFLGYEKNLKYFTPVTRAQLNMGLKLLDGESSVNSLQTIKEVTTLCLSKHADWIKFHAQEIAKVSADSLDDRKKHLLDLAEMERLALSEFKIRNYESAASIVLTTIKKMEKMPSKEKAWYFQFSAQLMYFGNKSQSNDLQSKACTLTTNMFHPQQGHVYKKILQKGVQPSIVKKRLESFERPQDILVYVNDILKELHYIPEIEAKHFEKKLCELGKFLGFSSQMPEKELGNGPDVLWCLTDGHYLILEAKSRSIHDAISKDNIGQLLRSEIWFKNQYGEAAQYTAVTLQSSEKKGIGVSIHEKIKVMDQRPLDLLHKNLLQFATALQSTHTKAHSENELSKLLEAYKFSPALFRDTYLKKIK